MTSNFKTMCSEYSPFVKEIKSISVITKFDLRKVPFRHCRFPITIYKEIAIIERKCDGV